MAMAAATADGASAVETLKGYKRFGLPAAVLAIIAVTWVFLVQQNNALHHEAGLLRTVNGELQSELSALRDALRSHENPRLRELAEAKVERDLVTIFSTFVMSVLTLTPLVALAAWYTRYRYRETKWWMDLTDHADTGSPLAKRVSYVADDFFSNYAGAKPLALATMALSLIFVGSIFLYSADGGDPFEGVWRAWSFIADPGTHADEHDAPSRLVAFILTVGGMLIFALFVAIVADMISERFDSLKKGKSWVIESGHTLILGWSDKVLPLVKQIAIANESVDGLVKGVIVILAEKDKEEMETEIGTIPVEELKGTEVKLRSGSPIVGRDLERVSTNTARAIIVLGDGGNADESDAGVLRIVLSLLGHGHLNGHIVVEIMDIDNNELVHLVGGEHVESVVAHDIIGRVMIQCARQPGLASVYEKMLGFEGNEFYLKSWDELVGKTFDEIYFSFPNAVPVGHRPANGLPYLNPSGDTVYEKGDEILVLAEDDDSYSCTDQPAPWNKSVPQLDGEYPLFEFRKILFCGWRRDIQDLIRELDALVLPDSELSIMCDLPREEREFKLFEAGLDPRSLKNVKLVHYVGNTTFRRHLERMPLEQYNAILILADESIEVDVTHTDSRSLATLLLIRDIQTKRLIQQYSKMSTQPQRGVSPPKSKSSHRRISTVHLTNLSKTLYSRRASVGSAFSATAVDKTKSAGRSDKWMQHLDTMSAHSIIISEILDSRTKELVSVSKASDYVLSNELVSMVIAMVAEDRAINHVLAEMFSARGCELYLKAAGNYVEDGEELNFWDLSGRLRLKNEVLIGYRKAIPAEPGEEEARTQYTDPILNPMPKSAAQTWMAKDMLVLLAD